MTDDFTPPRKSPHSTSVRKGLGDGAKTLIATVVASLAIATGIALYVSHEHGYLHCTTQLAPIHL
ncbi:MAG TPA: hypothetical protein PLS29_08320, partial [Acidimicrobiales bacterium]|nr:hypothetical protein [Acidimicrobiales bacterium]